MITRRTGRPCSFKSRMETFSQCPDRFPVHHSIWITCWYWFSHTEIDLTAVIVKAKCNQLLVPHSSGCFIFIILANDDKRHITEDITCNMHIIYFNTNFTAHTRLLFHKYYRTPHVVTDVITLTNKLVRK